MRKLIMWNVITLDGFFEGEKSWDLSFHDLIWSDEVEKFGIEQLKSADMLVFGRITYEGMAKYWTSAKGETAKYMNSIQKIVCSRTMKSVEWNNSRLVKDPVNEILKLKKQGNGNMFVFGSGNLSEALMKKNLFDEFRLLIAPLLLGKGRRLFNPGLNYQQLNLLESKNISSNGVILRYAPVSQK